MARKRASKPAEKWESYVFAIESIRPDYSFGLGDARLDQSVYSEHAHTEIVATCLAPKRFEGRVTTFVLIGSRSVTQELNNPAEERRNPLGVGTLTMRGERSDYLGSIPLDVLFGLAPPIIAGRLRFITLNGMRQRGSSTRINHMSFRTEVDPDEY